jgi:hypothetical protein
MAAKNQTSVKLDEFVAAVRGDPKASEPLLFTSGYVGRSATKGNLRIYSDPSLSRWIEAAEADVVHSVPIADSPLGGSHIWLKGSAKLSLDVAGPTGEPPGLEPKEPPLQLPVTQSPCLEPWYPPYVQEQLPFTRFVVCPTQPPMCIQEQAPLSTAIGCAAAGGPAPVAQAFRAGFTDAGCPTHSVPCETAPTVVRVQNFPTWICAVPQYPATAAMICPAYVGYPDTRICRTPPYSLTCGFETARPWHC